MPKILLPESILKARRAAIKKNGVKSVLPMAELNARWQKKKEHLEKIASNIRSLRYNLTRDLKSDDEKTRLTALVVSVMDCSAERVGNEDSESNGHFGVTGFQKKHVKVDGNTVTLKYKGKSGVEHEKSFSDPLIASVMKQAIKDSPLTDVYRPGHKELGLKPAKAHFIFTTSDGFRIRADKVNRYLNDYHITAKDIRGYCANTYIINQLKKQEIVVASKELPEEKAAKKRKSVFNKAVKYAAGKVGHGPATLKSHYLMPEVSRDYIEHGKIISLTDFFSKGGEVKSGEEDKKLVKPKISVRKKSCSCKHKLNKPVVKLAKGGKIKNLENSDKKTNFIPTKITKDEIQHVISGTRKVTNGATIHAAASYLKRVEKSSSVAKRSEHFKTQEAQLLKQYAIANNLWISDIDSKNYASQGAEQDVYFLDERTVIKTNYAIYYNSWLDYLNNLLLHNYFFPATAYELIGFTQNNGNLLSVVKQPLIKATEKTNLTIVEKFMKANGFENTKNDDYKNTELGIILEDLHDENVLTKDGVLYFVDTVFYLLPSEKLEIGGLLHGSTTLFDKFQKDKIGKGTGEQQYGWGIYFTDTKSLAKYYANLDLQRNINDIIQQYPKYKYSIAGLLSGTRYDIEAALLEVKKSKASKSEKTEIEKILNEIEQKVIGKRYLYEVTLNKGESPDQYDYMDWDNLITSGQKEKINSKINKLPHNESTSRLKSLLESPEWSRRDTGQKVYEYMVDSFEKGIEGQKDASLFLLNSGIDGIVFHYINDENINTTNYVVFDDKNISIERKIKFEKGGLIAPNGKPSNLTPEQYKLVRTPEFKEWFGDWEYDPFNSSKIIDQNGEPQVVYHGTSHIVTEFQRTSGEFGSGIYFTKETDTAKYYANLSSNWDPKAEKYIMNVFLNLRNPIEYKIRTAPRLLPMRKNLIKKGYDGVIGYTLNDSIEILAFESNQVKLADGTNTKFNPNNPDIRFEKGGMIAPNGKPSNLTPEQYKLVRTPEFKAWFGDWENDRKNSSKILDDNGEPKVVYHGSTSENFNVFKTRDGNFRNISGPHGKYEWDETGAFFTDNKATALSYADDNLLGVREFFLNMRTPIIAGYPGIKKEWEEIIPKIFMGGYDRDEKHDGFIAQNIKEMQDYQTTYNVKNPEQIKLADGTNTTFDSNDADIRYSLGGSIAAINTEDVEWITDDQGRKRFRIDDTSSKLDEDFVYQIIENVHKYKIAQEFPLGKVLYIWEGYKYYPSLKKNFVLFYYDELDERNGYYIRQENTISINVFKLFKEYGKYAEHTRRNPEKYAEQGANGKNKKLRLRPYLLQLFRRRLQHEIQHVVQCNEGIIPTRTDRKGLIEYILKKYKIEDLSQEQFEDFITKKHNTNYDKAIYLEYSSIPSEKECLDVESELAKYDHQKNNEFRAGGEIEKSEAERQIADGTNTTFDASDSDIRFEKGGNILTASSRFRPSETIIFDPPITGANGAQLISYKWAYEWTMLPNYEGELKSKRISDWSQAELSADTGKNIVHQFTVKLPDGKIESVSSESVLILLGYTDRKSIKSFPSLVNAIKTLAKNKMKLAILEAQEKEYKELESKFEKEIKPEVKEIEEPISFVRDRLKKDQHTVYAMGDVWYRQDNPFDYDKKIYKKIGHPEKNTIESLTSDWIKEKIKENGGKYPSELYDLRKRVERQERKVKELTKETSNETQQFKKGGEVSQSESETQIAEYIKEGIFLNHKDKPVIGVVDISRFNGDHADIFPGQNAVFISGVRKWIKKIKAGRRPYILVDYNERTDQYHVIDGHHRLSAYQHLGIKEIPVIDRSGKLKFEDGGPVLERKIIVHNNTNLAYDRVAQRMILEYLKSMNDKGRKVFVKFLDKSSQSIDNYDTVFYLNKDYHPSHLGQWYPNKIIYQTNVEAAYRNALNADDEQPSFIRVVKRDHVTHYIAYPEASLFGDVGAKYDDHGNLRDEVKRSAIEIISNALKVGKI